MSEQPSATVPEWDLMDRLRKSLREANVKPGEMAAYLSVSRNTVTNWMKGETRISGPALKLWAMRTGVPLEWLRDGENPPSPSGPGGREPVAAAGIRQARNTLPNSYRLAQVAA